MGLVFEILAITAILAGTLFSITGVLGFVRLPDVYTRLHATGKVGVFGVVLLSIAAISLTPETAGRGLVLIFLLLLSGPVTSHVIASAAYRLGLPMQQAYCDELADETG